MEASSSSEPSDRQKRGWNSLSSDARLSIIAIGLCVLGGIILGSATGNARASGLVILATIGVLVGLVAIGLSAWIPTVLIHELGHLVAGLLVGMKFRRIDVCGVSLARTPDGWNLGFRPTPGAGGLCFMDPIGGTHLARRLRWYIRGGPLATQLLFAVSCLFVYWINNQVIDTWLERGLQWFAIILAITNFAVMLRNVRPSSDDGLANDAGLLWQLRSDTSESARYVALTLLSAQAQASVPHREWPLELIEALDQPRDASLPEVSARMCRSNWYAAMEDHAAARKELERASEIARDLPYSEVGVWRQVVAYELAAYIAFNEGDANAARAALPLEEISEGLDASSAHAKAHLAIALVEQDAESAKHWLQQVKGAFEQERRAAIRHEDNSAFFVWVDACIESMGEVAESDAPSATTGEGA